MRMLFKKKKMLKKNVQRNIKKQWLLLFYLWLVVRPNIMISVSYSIIASGFDFARFFSSGWASHQGFLRCAGPTVRPSQLTWKPAVVAATLPDPDRASGNVSMASMTYLVMPQVSIEHDARYPWILPWKLNKTNIIVTWKFATNPNQTESSVKSMGFFFPTRQLWQVTATQAPARTEVPRASKSCSEGPGHF